MTDRETVAARVEAAFGERPATLRELDGGMIGEVYRADFPDRPALVAKVGDTPLSVEARMLRALDDAGLPVPAVEHASDELLLMEYVDADGPITPAVERDVADHLAALHGETASAYGFPFDTLTGPLDQPNPWTDSWVAFFRDQRLRYMAELVREGGELSASLHDRVERVADSLGELLVEPERPTLIHGDCWRENVLACERGDGVAAFLDPACYYAHREVELAYVRWTDAFGDPFFERYRERRGIDPGFEERYPVYALYPTLTHVRLFGEEYLPALRALLDAVEW
ncbi:MAG: fructosamine kinase family protein [Haloarculaceae archaeon]